MGADNHRTRNRLIHREGKKFCAIALCVSLILGNVAGMAIAADGNYRDGHEFEMSQASLYQALQKAVSEGNTVSREWEFFGEEAEEYEELLEPDGSLYELEPEIQNNDGSLKLRVFARVEQEISLDTAYEAEGTEQVIFLLTNTSKQEQKAIIRVGEKYTEAITVVPGTAIKVSSSDDPYQSAADFKPGLSGGSANGSGGSSNGSGSGTGSTDNTGSTGTAGTMVEDTLPDADEQTQGDESQGQEKEPDQQLPAENGNKIDEDKGSDANGNTGNDISQDSDRDADIDIDTDTGIGADVDIDADTGNDADTGSDSDTGSNVDTDMDADMDSDTDTADIDNSSDTDTGSEISISWHPVYRVAAAATSSDAEQASPSDAEEATGSDAERKNQLDGTLYEAVRLEDDGAVAFALTTEELGFLEDDPEATPSNAVMYFEKELDTVTVQASTDAGVLPEDAELKVVVLDAQGSHADQYQEAKEVLDAKGAGYDGMMAFDISFVDGTGEETEPEGEVNVSIKLKKEVLPEDADPESLMVHHLAESDGEIILENVADGAGGKNGSIEVTAAEAIAEFYVESFSTFAVTWSSSENIFFQVTVHRVDENGTEIGNPTENETITYRSNGSNAYALAEYASERPISGYTYVSAHYGSSTGSRITEMTTSETGYQGWKTRYLIFYDEKDGIKQQVEQLVREPRDGVQRANIYLKYALGSVQITDTIIDDGLLNAVVNGNTAATYKWFRSDNGRGDSWTEVKPEKVSEDRFNIVKDGAAVYVSLDGGAQKYYKVEAYDAAGALIGTSEAYQVPYYAELRNGSFEKPVITDFPNSGGGHVQVSNRIYKERGGVWQTTGVGTGNHKGADIEIIRQGVNDNSVKRDYSWNGSLEVPDGNQFVELNCEAAGALYQDVLTVPGVALNYWLSHRARGNKKSDIKEWDTMYVVIMSTAMANNSGNPHIDGAIDTQREVRYVINHAEEFDNVYVEEYTSSDQRWEHYREIGAYTVPEDQHLTRFFFVAGNTASGNATVGNFLDAVGFGQELPPPTPGKGNLSITKVVRGLSPDDAEEYAVSVTIDGPGFEHRTFSLDHFHANPDGSYSASVQDDSLLDVDIGIYTITEQIPEAVAKKLETGYMGPVSEFKVNQTVVTNGKAEVLEGKDTNAVFTNTYTKNTVTLQVRKEVTGNMGERTRDFHFSYSVDGVEQTPFTLKHNESTSEITVPWGSRIVITETDGDQDGYSTSYQKNTADPVAGTACTIEKADGDMVVVFTNHKEMKTETGVFRDSFPYLMMLLPALLGMCALIWGGCRRSYRRRREE